MAMSEDSIPIEIDMRGAAMKLSITIESILMKIVYFSNAEQYKIKGAKSLKLKGCMFRQKILRVRKMLEKFHPDLLQNNKQLLDKLDVFNLFRNQMAHCGFYWGKSLSEFEVWDIVEDENKFQFYQPFEYSVYQAYTRMDNTLKNIIPPLIILSKEIQSRLKLNSPTIYAELKAEGNFPKSN